MSEEKLITEQAIVKWILASLCQPSKLAICYPAVATVANAIRSYLATYRRTKSGKVLFIILPVSVLATISSNEKWP